MEDSRQSQDDLFDFAIRLYREAGNTTSGNVVISPYSVSIAMAMLLGGARENTANQLTAVLGQFGYKALRNLKPLQSAKGCEDGIIFLSANKLFSEQSFAVHEQFLKESEQDFSTSVSPLDLVKKSEESRIFINKWVEQQTNGIIQNLLPSGSIDALTKLVIANAIYFKGIWANKFEKSKTTMSTFHLNENETRQVEMMSQKRKLNIHYDHEFGVQVVELPYKKGNASMILVVPTERFGLKSLETKLTSKKLQAFTGSFSLEEVVLSLPRMKINFDIDLVSAFKALGVSDVFNPDQANLEGISNDPGLYVSGIFHKAFLEVSEEGTEAAAATAVVVRLRSMPIPPVVVTCDHPFMILIRDNATNSILFMGRFSSP